jgi:hypothetical protein
MTTATLPPAVASLARGTLTALGHLDVDGELTVGDPGLMPDGSVVKVALPAGRYAVGALAFSPRRVHALYAAADGAEVVSLEELGSFGVDCGMAGFWTDAAETGWREQPEEDYENWFDVIDSAIGSKRAGMVTVGDARFAACLSGDGDGVYPVFAGKDASGAVVAVLTVFIPASAPLNHFDQP